MSAIAARIALAPFENVSNTPWAVQPARGAAELTRHGLPDQVDAAVFCMDVGWRKPHRAPFDSSLIVA